MPRIDRDQFIAWARRADDVCSSGAYIDAVRLGFRATLVEDSCCRVGLRPVDIPSTLAAMRQAGVIVTTSAEVGHG